MGRAPCCEKIGLKKGPWTPEEDQILVSYILQHGHSNWRALPKQAGLLRCGKSCRLRWVNYLKPDIKRGGFTLEEEEAIIKLHELLGNRWSAIAARLPGRTDNEIKNVWHTHLKKKLSDAQSKKEENKKKIKSIKTKPSNNEENNNKMNEEITYFQAGSSQQSSTTTTTTTDEASSLTEDSSMESFPEIDESFWTENLSIDDFEIVSMTDNIDQVEKLGFQDAVGGGLDEEMDFWYNVFIQTGGPQELQELNLRV